jgi:hypothetical protein
MPGQALGRIGGPAAPGRGYGAAQGPGMACGAVLHSGDGIGSQGKSPWAWPGTREGTSRGGRAHGDGMGCRGARRSRRRACGVCGQREALSKPWGKRACPRAALSTGRLRGQSPYDY